MKTEINNVPELAGLTEKLIASSNELTESLDNLKSIVGRAKDYDGIDVTTAGNILKNNLKVLSNDMKNAAKNMKSYSTGIENLDVDDFTTQSDTFSLSLGNKIGGFISGIVTSYTTGLDKIGKAIMVPFTNNDENSNSNNQSEMQSTPEGQKNSVAIPRSEYVNPNPELKETGNLRDKITQRTTYTTNKGTVVISPGDPNVDLDLSVYHNNPATGFQVTTGNPTYELSQQDLQLMYGLVASESDKTYDDALGVATTILNRCETSNWVNAHSQNPIEQITAPGQFEVYSKGTYKQWQTRELPETVVKAVNDALSGVRNHDYCYFRSNGSNSYSDNMITQTGNRYGYK